MPSLPSSRGSAEADSWGKGGWCSWVDETRLVLVGLGRLQALGCGSVQNRSRFPPCKTRKRPPRTGQKTGCHRNQPGLGLQELQGIFPGTTQLPLTLLKPALPPEHQVLLPDRLCLALFTYLFNLLLFIYLFHYVSVPDLSLSKC